MFLEISVNVLETKHVFLFSKIGGNTPPNHPSIHFNREKFPWFSSILGVFRPIFRTRPRFTKVFVRANPATFISQLSVALLRPRHMISGKARNSGNRKISQVFFPGNTLENLAVYPWKSRVGRCTSYWNRPTSRWTFVHFQGGSPLEMIVEKIGFLFRLDFWSFVLLGKDGVNFNLFCLFFRASELSSQHSRAMTLFIGLWQRWQTSMKYHTMGTTNLTWSVRVNTDYLSSSIPSPVQKAKCKQYSSMNLLMLWA